MIARAPGKLVLSGAYAVLAGAPALVAAIDRFVTADASRPAAIVTAEVAAAVAAGALPAACWFDAGALRAAVAGGGSRKLGVGSSAAILVATLAASLGDRPGDEASLREAIFPLALAAHRAAQGGGSGVDVAASVFGGVLVARLAPEDGSLRVRPHALPEGAVVEVFGSPTSASTSELLARVRALAADPRGRAAHRRLLDEAGRAAEAAVEARATSELVGALNRQFDALGALGDAAQAAIVIPEVAALREAAAAEGAAFGPSGAGGGDIATFVGPAPASPSFRALAQARGLSWLALSTGARGAHRVG